MKRFLLGGFLFCITLNAVSQAKGDRVEEVPLSKDLNVSTLLPIDTLVFSLARPGVNPAEWGFEIHHDGQGRYYEKGISSENNPSGNEWKDIRVTPASMELLLAGFSKVATAKGCETSVKNIAQTGKKKLSYVRGDIWLTCEFNYSDDAGVMRSVSAYQAIAQTIQTGTKLKHDHRFDHLGLDADLDGLTNATKSGYAIELQNISPVLKSIVDDEEMMSSVRRKATALLQLADLQASAR